jgi:hypothetical protein
MHIGRSLKGRMERRLPIMIAVRLSRGGGFSAGEQVTYTDNVSLHSARVVSNCAAWQIGEHADIAPVKKGSSMHGGRVLPELG